MAAVNVDSEELADVVRRLRRAQGQIGGVIRMIEDGQECSDVLTQLAAAARALDRAGFKIIASGLCQCVLDEQAGRPPQDTGRRQACQAKDQASDQRDQHADTGGTEAIMGATTPRSEIC